MAHDSAPHDPALYDAFAMLGSGVCLVTVRASDGDRFFVAASVLTASVDPFALAVSVGAGRPALPAMLDGESWTLSVLDATHAPLVDALTGPTTHAERVQALTAAGARRSPEGGLWLPDALASFWCRTASTTPVNDQVLVVGNVDRARVADGRPLLRWNHTFGTIGAVADERSGQLAKV